MNGLISQSQSLPDGLVEIVVSENAGADGTAEYLAELVKQFPHIVINLNRVNVGADANIYLLPSLASGTYLWILGDDDFLEPGALKEIIEVLRTGPDYIAVNFAASDETLTRKGVPYWNLDRNLEVRSLKECCACVPHFAMGFISAWIARRELFNKISVETYSRFARWGLSVMLDRYASIAAAKHGVILAGVMLTTRKQSVSEHPPNFDYFNWFFEGSAAVFAYLQDVMGLDKGIVQTRKSWLLRKIAIKRILYERAAGIIDVRRVNKILLGGYGDRWEYWMGCVPALYVPGLGALAGAIRRLGTAKPRGDK